MENAIMNLNDMPITMDEPTPTPDPQAESASRLFHALAQTMAAYVRSEIRMGLQNAVAKLVEDRFDELVTNRNTLKLMDEEMFKRIEVMIENAVDTHEVNKDHADIVEVEQVAADTARETLSEYASKQEGWVTSDQVNDLITEHVDEELDRIDWDEKVKDVLREML
jgi:flagellar basal body rod protein FlgC